MPNGPIGFSGTITAAQLHQLELNLAGSVNGVDGSTHAPASPIIITNLVLSAAQQCPPLLITRGGLVTSNVAGGVQCQDNDVPQLAPGHAGRTRPFAYACGMGRGIPRYAWKTRREDAGLQAYAASYDDSSGVGPRPALAYVRLRAHDGATLSTVAVSFRVIVPHVALPPTMPLLRVLREDVNGNLTSLLSSAQGADAQGYVAIPTPTSASAWNNGGLTQTITLTCDQNNVVAVGTYRYYLEITEEQGLTGYPFALVYKSAVRAASAGSPVTLSGLQTIDGVTLSNGDRFLAKDQTDQTQNGILIVHPSAWTRAPDLQQPNNFIQGMVIPVDQGNTNGGTYWQVTPTISSWTSGNMPASATTWAASTSYALNAVVTPTTSHATGFWYQATAVAGTPASGATEPTWPTTIGQTVVDNPGANQITWTCMGLAPVALTFQTKADVSNPVEGTAYFGHGIVWQLAVCTFTGIVDTRPQ